MKKTKYDQMREWTKARDQAWIKAWDKIMHNIFINAFPSRKEKNAKNKTP